jgi:NADPH-dependent curcumin reductase CurA
MSVDPYLRGGLKNREGLLGTGAVKGGTGERVMSGFVAGRVEASKSDKYQVGDLIGVSANFSTLQILSKETLAATLSWKLPDMVTEENISLGVGALGMPGSTAYGGFIDVLRPKKGQTVFVSAASGAVGSIVGQIAKNVYECTVIGSCGGAEKGEIIKSRYGFDSAIDYRALPEDKAEALASLTASLKEAAPEGIDMYFENVGGVHFEASMASLRRYGRVAVCGCISGYNEAKSPANSINIGDLIYTFQRVEGFVCMPWLSGAQGNFLEDMSTWIQDGRVKTEETFFDGIESWPDAFQSLFTGKKLGKVVVRL